MSKPRQESNPNHRSPDLFLSRLDKRPRVPSLRLLKAMRLAEFSKWAARESWSKMAAGCWKLESIFSERDRRGFHRAAERVVLTKTISRVFRNVSN